MIVMSLVAAVGVAVAGGVGPAQEDPGRLYGRVTTTDGTVYEGHIRWDGNEAGWYDILHGSKPLPERFADDLARLSEGQERNRKRSIEIFGLEIRYDRDEDDMPSSASSGIRFGHISTLEVVDRRRARLILRSGEVVEFDGGGDVGRNVSEIIVEDGRRGSVELEWEDVEIIDFSAGRGLAAPAGARLYGTLETRDGERFTGYVAWDMDEVLTTDVLDGEEDGRDREIPFGQIGMIERNSSSSARVRLLDGTEMVLRGSNDVNNDNRDILIADPDLGEIRVEWSEFDHVEFSVPPASVDLARFDGGRRIRGTVETHDGASHSGFIRWDNDEEYGWELLDGELRDGVDMDVEFDAIERIEPRSGDGALVTLRDGRSFELSDSNDVDDDNKGIIITGDDEEMRLVWWEDLRSARFHR